MTLAITGTTGFIGRRLLAHTAQRTLGVIPLTRDVLAADDVALTGLLTGCDTLVHLAGRAHKNNPNETAAFERDNYLLSRRLFDIAHRAGVRHVVFLSTIGVYGRHPSAQPITRHSPLNPDTAYARTKLQAEQDLSERCQRTGMTAAIIRPPLVYGPKAPGNIGKLQKLIRLGIPLPFANIRNQRSLIALDTLCNVILDAAQNKKNTVLLPHDAQPLSTPELLRLLAAQDNRRLRLFPFPQMLLRRLLGHKAPLWEDYRLAGDPQP